MKLEIEVDVIGVHLADFEGKIVAPAFIDSVDGGVKMTFLGIDSLKEYKSALIQEDAEEVAGTEKEIKDKINKGLKKAISEHITMMDSIRVYSEALFTFIYSTDAHREDKKYIFNELIEGLKVAENDGELETAIKDSTYEMGEFTIGYKMAFRKYSCDFLNYDFIALRDQLVADLIGLQKSL
ncbi:hypothetical protein AQ505_20805 [Pedobacter sp. PACM 27299]|uniref:hypothetical protein n=1 Tax=Pedobacter sp. PACM 27299 TaxID=1727164 RepID=UPI0007067793|nr:hypothetical protein [Pedobacter sp. PACM 27299]ALL07717.1 hypothetical protein AQ505_20805 [Pedobacter sp. PACM 27299]